VADIVFIRIFGAPFIEKFPQSAFDRIRVMPFLDNIVLMKHLAKQMAMIKLVDQARCNVIRQMLEPTCAIAWKGDVESNDVLRIPATDGATSDSGAYSSEGM
jgi:hypothetical protein